MPIQSTRWTVLLVSLTVVCCLSPPAAAGDFIWIRAAGSDQWYDKTPIPGSDPPEYMNNWGRTGNPPAFPDATSDVFISKAVGGYTVHLDNNASIADLTIGSGDSLAIHAILTVNGNSMDNASQITVDKVFIITSLRVNDPGTILSGGGALTVFDGTGVRGADGDERLTNVDNTISGAGRLGEGNLALTNQALIDANVAGTLIVQPNAGGVINTGTMQASSGGTLRLYDGAFTNTGGVIQALTGSEANLDNSAVVGGTLATSGTGVVTVSHLTTLQDVQQTGSMEVNPGGNLVLKGTFTNTGNIDLKAIGALDTKLRADGTVTLTGGGTITLADSWTVFVTRSGASGTLINVDNTISGAGFFGNDTLTITNTGTIAATGSCELVVDLAGTGGMTNDGIMRAVGAGGFYLRDSAFTNAGTVEILSGSRLDFETLGTYLQTGGTTSLDNGLLIAKTVNVQGGSVTGTGTIDAAVNVTGGSVAPGLSAGTLNVDGNLVLGSGGTLQIELESGSVFDVLNVTGSADLGGMLEVLPRGGYDPAPGTEFPVLTTTKGVAGAFDDITSGFWTRVDGNNLVLLVAIPGDADLNGYVDLPDLIALARNWHVSPATWDQGNFDGDNIVDLPDLIILARNWHAGTPPPAAGGELGRTGGAVPEPASAVLLLAGAALAIARRRR